MMRLLHGSPSALPRGYLMQPRSSVYERNWGSCDFYRALEHHRPAGLPKQSECIFMGHSLEDVDLAGASLEYLLVVEPQGAVSRHDVNWVTALSALLGDGHGLDHPKVIEAAHAYWQGLAHPDESVWEYLCPAVKVLACISGQSLESGLIDPDPLVLLDEAFGMCAPVGKWNNVPDDSLQLSV